MKTWALGLFAGVVAVAASGCGKQDVPQTAAPVHCDTGISCKVAVDEKQAAETYAKFKYQKVGSCADNSRRFTWLIGSDRLVVAKTSDGNDVVADLAIFLNDDGTYTGVYREKTQVRGEVGFWKTTEIKNKKDLAGTWALQRNQIMISDLGLGDAATVRGWPGVQFTLAKDTKINATLGEKQLNLILTRSLVSKDGQTIEQACADEKAQAEKAAETK